MKTRSEPTIPLKRIIASMQSGTSVNGAPWPAAKGRAGVLKTSAVYGGVFEPAENKEVVPEEVGKASCSVRAGDLIVSRMNTRQHLGVAAVVRRDYPHLYLPDRLWSVTFEGTDSRFVDWWTKTDLYRTQVEAVSVGTSSSMQNISQADFGEIRIHLPRLEIQRLVADYLDRETARIDTLIEEQQRLIEMLRERRRAVATRAVLFGIDEAHVVDSGDPALGSVPEHWTVKSVRHWLQSLDGQRVPLSAEERGSRGGEFAYYGASGVIDHVDDYLYDEPLVLVSEDGANLVARNSPIAFAAKGRYWVNNHAHVLRPWVGGDVDYWAHRLEALDIQTVVSGSAQPKLTAGALMSLRVSAPAGVDEQQRIAAHIGEKTTNIDRLVAETERFIELSRERRAALITAAVTGQIDVREVA